MVLFVVVGYGDLALLLAIVVRAEADAGTEVVAAVETIA